jgi:hypothetical protein
LRHKDINNPGKNVIIPIQMRIVTFKKIKAYTDMDPQAEVPLKNWYNSVRKSEWNCFADYWYT